MNTSVADGCSIFGLGQYSVLVPLMLSVTGGLLCRKSGSLAVIVAHDPNLTDRLVVTVVCIESCLSSSDGRFDKTTHVSRPLQTSVRVARCGRTMI